MRLPGFLSALFATCLMLAASSAAKSANDEAMLRESFEPARFVAAEKRVLQTGLALLGYFRGPINGRWGVASQQAFENYAAAKFGDQPRNRMVAVLVDDLQREISKRGWRYEYLPDMNISVAIPSSEMVRDAETDEFIEWRDEEGGIAMELRRHPFGQLGTLHARVVSDSELVGEREELQEDDRWISRAQHINGDSYYIYSHRAGDTWFSLLVNATKSREPLFKAVTASIRQGSVDGWPALPELGFASLILRAAAQRP